MDEELAEELEEYNHFADTLAGSGDEAEEAEAGDEAYEVGESGEEDDGAPEVYRSGDMRAETQRLLRDRKGVSFRREPVAAAVVGVREVADRIRRRNEERRVAHEAGEPPGRRKRCSDGGDEEERARKAAKAAASFAAFEMDDAVGLTFVVEKNPSMPAAGEDLDGFEQIEAKAEAELLVAKDMHGTTAEEEVQPESGNPLQVTTVEMAAEVKAAPDAPTRAGDRDEVHQVAMAMLATSSGDAAQPVAGEGEAAAAPEAPTADEMEIAGGDAHAAPEAEVLAEAPATGGETQLETLPASVSPEGEAMDTQEVEAPAELGTGDKAPVRAAVSTAAAANFMDDVAGESDGEGGDVDQEDEAEAAEDGDDLEGFVANDSDEGGSDDDGAAHRALDLEEARAEMAAHAAPAEAPAAGVQVSAAARRPGIFAPNSRAAAILARARALPSKHPLEARFGGGAAPVGGDAAAGGDGDDELVLEESPRDAAADEGETAHAAVSEDSEDAPSDDERHREEHENQLRLDRIADAERERTATGIPSLEGDSQQLLSMLHRVDSRSRGFAHTRDGTNSQMASRPLLLRSSLSQSQAGDDDASFLNIFAKGASRSGVSTRDGTSGAKSFVFNRVDPNDPDAARSRGAGGGFGKPSLHRQSSAKPPPSAGARPEGGLFGRLAKRQGSLPASLEGLGGEGDAPPRARPGLGLSLGKAR